ncbi:hypothetical protein NQZ68_018037 [Dissostichus eleginoides]|nr:hypothetical protein NQZ68_018037 [Dissostichus eleginoides]
MKGRGEWRRGRREETEERFVAQPNCQQLLATLWYDGFPGWRRRHWAVKLVTCFIIGLLFPFFSLVRRRREERREGKEGGRKKEGGKIEFGVGKERGRESVNKKRREEIYLLAPKSALGRFVKKPFIKFICHTASYLTFLFLLLLASQHIARTNLHMQGPPPTLVEWMILPWVVGFIWAEIKEMWDGGFTEYIHDWWNLMDFAMNSLYLATISLKIVAYVKSDVCVEVAEEARKVCEQEGLRGECVDFLKISVELQETQRIMGSYPAVSRTPSNLSHLLRSDDYCQNVLYNSSRPREEWEMWHPTLIAEALFAIANIFSSLRLISLFTANSHLGPLQISLGRMLLDILKFLFIYCLVLLAFANGLNQLYFYYETKASEEPNNCKGIRCERQNNAFSTLFETLQSLFWSIFGLLNLYVTNVKARHEFTEFVGATMFGTYNVISLVVLLNMLIAMMNNSYQLIADHADIEWKFARTKLWMSYFDEGGTLPPPFNIIPSPKSILFLLLWLHNKLCRGGGPAGEHSHKCENLREFTERHADSLIQNQHYQEVIRSLVKRYVAAMIRSAKTDEGLTEENFKLQSLFPMMHLERSLGFEHLLLSPYLLFTFCLLSLMSHLPSLLTLLTLFTLFFLSELKQDISSFRYEVLDLLGNRRPPRRQYSSSSETTRDDGAAASEDDSESGDGCSSQRSKGVTFMTPMEDEEDEKRTSPTLGVSALVRSISGLTRIEGVGDGEEEEEEMEEEEEEEEEGKPKSNGLKTAVVPHSSSSPSSFSSTFSSSFARTRSRLQRLAPGSKTDSFKRLSFLFSRSKRRAPPTPLQSSSSSYTISDGFLRPLRSHDFDLDDVSRSESRLHEVGRRRRSGDLIIGDPAFSPRRTNGGRDSLLLPLPPPCPCQSLHCASNMSESSSRLLDSSEDVFQGEGGAGGGVEEGGGGGGGGVGVMMVMGGWVGPCGDDVIGDSCDVIEESVTTQL